MKYDVIIIGAGAAGLMAAIEAGKNGRRVLLLEHNRKVGQKILISGGGRCNFTNMNAAPENYISSNPHFIKSAFSEYTPSDFIVMVERHGIDYYEKTLGQLFCRKSSREIVSMLLKECDDADVEIRTGITVKSVSNKNEEFTVKTDSEEFLGGKCIVACGGLSFPKKGASDLGYRIAKQFGHNIIDTRPGLVPVTVDQAELSKLEAMSGVSFDSRTETKLEAKGRKRDISFKEATLITHRGFSGPAILQISSYLNNNGKFNINIEPDINWEDYLDQYKSSNKEVKNILADKIPMRLAEHIAELSEAHGQMSQLKKSAKANLLRHLNEYEITPNGTEGYPKAEVTIGGVDTRELNQRTMESKHCPGLYFIGEVVDVTGWLGGYNFQWAWASGYVSGRDI
jgi:predicted Rossmann fold flavoprotein